uniref:ABC transporter domain-containing protein n=1 Tax=Oryza punctata TaxID=4537 RepID=A0A0E0M7X9_ORYPU
MRIIFLIAAHDVLKNISKRILNLSDYICCLYEQPGAYGVVTLPFSVREGVNIFLAGFIPTENLRFRDESLYIQDAEEDAEIKTYQLYKYPTTSKTIGNFKLIVTEGEFTDSEIVVMLGENGRGRPHSSRCWPGWISQTLWTELILKFLNCVSYKPQKLSSTYQGTVRQFLHEKIRDSYTHPQFVSDVMKPLKLDQLMDQEVQHLLCGQLQRVALCICLGKPADIYLIDEPSASLDSEQHLVASMVIKRFIMHAKKIAFVVEYDFIMATYLADKVIVYEGQPAVDCTANAPQSLLSGMNKLFSHLQITFRRDPTNFRPRINKLDSAKDRQQKLYRAHDVLKNISKRILNLSDYICCLYEQPGAYGVVTLPFSITDAEEDAEIKTYQLYKYPTTSKTIGNFKLIVTEGEFTDSEIVVMLGENGRGRPHSSRCWYISLHHFLHRPSLCHSYELKPGWISQTLWTELILKFLNCVSYKPQKLSSTYQGTVRQFLHEKIRDSYTHPQFVSDVMKPLKLDQLMDQEVQHLLCGQLQRVALCICLGKPADIYLIDEPSASLDSEQHLVASMVIKRFIMHAKKIAFVVEYDFIMATYLADKVIVYEGQPAVDCTANAPQSLLSGMNKLFSHLQITFRRDPTNFRPRINKLDSAKDRQQKSAGSYYYL